MANQLGTFLAYLNKVEDATLTTAADVQGERVVANLATRESDDVWRFLVSGGSTTATAIATWDSDQTVQVLTAQFPRTTYTGVSESSPSFASSDTIQWVLKNSGGTTIYDSTAEASNATPGYMTAYHKMASQLTTVRSLEVTFDATSRVSAGFCDVGMIGAWPIIEPSVGFSYPGGYGWRHNTNNQTTTAGRMYTARFDPMREWSLEFDFLTNDEANTIDEMNRYAGGARQVFVRRGDLPTGKDAMLALLSARSTQSRTATRRQAPLTFEEFI